METLTPKVVPVDCTRLHALEHSKLVAESNEPAIYATAPITTFTDGPASLALVC